jgi:hypothetical protein
VLVNGVDVFGKYEVIAVEVEKAIDRMGRCVLTVREGEASAEGFPVSSSEDFEFGNELEIRLGYGGLNQSVFKGIVFGQRLRTDGDATVLSVDVRDKAINEAGAVVFDMPQLESEAVLSVTFGVDILDFDLRGEAPSQAGSDGDSARSMAMRADLAKSNGRIRFPGSALAAPGKLIVIQGLGRRFDGNGYISGVRHLVREGAWTTEVEIGLAAAASAPGEKSGTKSIVTRSGMRLIFDEEKKSVLLQTPAGNQALLDDDARGIEFVDQTGNRIKMTAGGIEISSPKDIQIEAAGKISITSKSADISVNGTQGVWVKGLKVDLEADTQLTAKGNVGAELSSSAVTTVKGLTVMIN